MASAQWLAAAVSAKDAVWSTAYGERWAAARDLWPRHLLTLLVGLGGRARGQLKTLSSSSSFSSSPSPSSSRSQEAGWSSLPAGVVWPQSVLGLQRVVAAAGSAGVALVPYGAGSSVVGGASTSACGALGAGDRPVWVLDLKGLHSVDAVDVEGRYATAQAGILGERFERLLNQKGMTQGHFPSSIYCSTLGGWIGARSAGQMSSRYGKIEDQLLGGTVVLGDGRVLQQGPCPTAGAKLNTLIGAEGTLGVWAHATVRIHPLPAAQVWRGLRFRDLQQALGAAEAWLKAGLVPQVVRIYDPLDTFLHRKTHVEAPQPRDHGPSWITRLGAALPRTVQAAVRVGWRGACCCILGFADASSLAVAEQMMAAAVGMARRSFGAQDLGPGPGLAWYRERYAVSYKQSNAFRAGVAIDTMEVACAWPRALAVYQAVRAAALAQGVQVLAHFSHVYEDGVSIYFTYAMPLRLGVAGYDRLWAACMRAAWAAGANVSHHHGLGALKRPWWQQVQRTAWRAWERLGLAWDPAAVLVGGGGAPHRATVVEQSRLQTPYHAVVRAGVGSIAASDPHPEAAALRQGMHWLVLRPEVTVGQAAAQAKAQGRWLGPLAEVCGNASVGSVVQRDAAWCCDPQLNVVARLTVAAGGGLGQAAPRHAQGPGWFVDGEIAAGDGDEVVWRTFPAPSSRQGAAWWLPVPAGDAALALRLARTIACTDPLRGTILTLCGNDDMVVLHARFPQHLVDGEGLARLQTAAVACLGAVGADWSDNASGLADPLSRGLAPPVLRPVEQIGATWDVLLEALPAQTCGRAWALPWLDPVGAVGWLAGSEGDQATGGQDAWVPPAALRAWLVAPQTSTSEPKAPEDHAPVNGPDEAHAVVVPGKLLQQTRKQHQSALDNCTYCPKLCRFACPTAVAEGSEAITPRQLMLSVRLHASGHHRLKDDMIRALFSCVDCRGCGSYCAHGNDVASTLQQARAELVAARVVPAQLLAGVRQATVAGSGWSEHRLAEAWRATASLEALGPWDTAARTWVVQCCTPANDDEAPSLVAFTRLAQHAFGDVHLASRVPSCGHGLYRWGDREGFAQQAKRFVAAVPSHVERLLVTEPSCAYALRELYPKMKQQIVTPLELLAQVKGSMDPMPQLAAFDDCYSSRWLGEGRGLREWLAQRACAPATGATLSSANPAGDAGCCGGLLLGYYSPKLADAVARETASDVKSGGARGAWVVAPGCRCRLRAGGLAVHDPGVALAQQLKLVRCSS